MPYKTVGKFKKLYKKRDSAALMGGQIYPRNISESPEINRYVYGQFILKKKKFQCFPSYF